MNNLLCFDFDERPVRVVVVDSTPWWVAADVCAILGLANVTMAMRKLDDDQITLNLIEGASNGKPVNLVSESGLWTLVLRSDKPQAVAIRRWLTDTVLPALRRTGRFEMAGAGDDRSEAPAAGLDLHRVTVALNLVREARKLFGVATAQGIWLEMGLPAPSAAEAPALFADGLAADVRTYCSTVADCTIDDVAAALGLPEGNHAQRTRIGRILRALGWYPWKVRRHGRSVNLFAPRFTAAMEA